MPAAVIFDFDGVLVDTEPLHYRALRAVLAPLGMDFDWAAYVSRYIGLDDRGVFRAAFREAGLPLSAERERELIAEKAAAFAAFVRETPPPALPGVERLLAELRGAVPLALCSGALPADIEPVLRQRGWDDVFEVRVTAEDVEESKPNPASYVLAFRRLAERRPQLRLIPARCVAIEDTEAGVASAKGAGLQVLWVGRNGNAAPRDGVWQVSSLSEISRRRLEEVFDP